MMAIALTHDGSGVQPRLMDVAVPVPGDDEVLVRVRAVGVGVHDRWFIPRDARFPYVIGIEAAGVVERVGTAVAGWTRGDRVMFTNSMQPKGGVWAEFTAVDASALLRVPDDLTFAQAAALPVAGSTAYGSVVALGAEPGGTVFMAGASGAIGTLTIQVATERGWRVAASSSPRNHDYMRSLGAELAVDYGDPSWPGRVLDWRPNGVDAALAIQPGTGALCLPVVKDSGRIVTVSGDQLRGERVIEVVKVMPSPESKTALAGLASKVAAGQVRVEIEAVYPFERGIEALEKTETRHARGKVLLTLE